MQKDKNKWVEDVLGSADQMRRAGAPDMADRVLSRIHSKQVSLQAGSPIIWRIAASVALLIALNATTIYIYSSRHHGESQGRSEDTAAVFGLGSGEATHADMGTVFFGN